MSRYQKPDGLGPQWRRHGKAEEFHRWFGAKMQALIETFKTDPEAEAELRGWYDSIPAPWPPTRRHLHYFTTLAQTGDPQKATQKVGERPSRRRAPDPPQQPTAEATG